MRPQTSRLEFIRLMWRFFVRDAKTEMSYRLQFFFQVAGIFSVCVSFFFMSLMMRRVESGITSLGKYGGSYFGFAIVGAAMSTYLDSSLRSLGGSIRTAQVTGTLEAMLTTRATIGPIVTGSGIYTLLYTTIRTLMYFVFAAFLFELPVHFETWPAVSVIMLLTISSTMVLSVVAAGFIVWFKQGDPLTAALSGLSWLLSGVLYPKEILPAWVQDVAAALPMTHTLEAMRLALLTGATLTDLRPQIAFLAVFSALGIPVAIAWFRFAVGRAKMAGSLARY